MAIPQPHPWPQFTFFIAEIHPRDPTMGYVPPTGGFWLPPKNQGTNVAEPGSYKYFRCNGERIFRIFDPLPQTSVLHSAYSVYMTGHKFCIVNHDATDMPVGDGRWRLSDPRGAYPNPPMTYNWRFLCFRAFARGSGISIASMLGAPEHLACIRADQRDFLYNLLPRVYHGPPTIMMQQGAIISDLALFLAIIAHSVPPNRTQRQFERGYASGRWFTLADHSGWPEKRGILIKIFADDPHASGNITAFEQNVPVVP